MNKQIDIDNIHEGVDRKQLAQLKQRFLSLNQQRHTRTCDALSERQQHFLMLLPLLFHVNHPMLPGYLSHAVPCGIVAYKPDKEELRLAKTMARSFHYARDLQVTETAIDALFVMGSIGTIAHSDTSDLDIWICHSAHLSLESQQLLEQKCALISRWAAQQIRLEIHCFLMRSDKFSDYPRRGLSSEASGSAQHYLLLDEFYRTAVWLAGKVPLWWFVPASQEAEYDRYTQILLSKRFVKANDVIDFGGLPAIPPNEFVGAGIWQLYKAIESPYKSVLKLLLLEVYASAMTGVVTTEPLALTFKRAVYADEPDANALDPYLMVYQRIEQYLQAREQWQRLDLMRRCFYFKVDKPLSRGHAASARPRSGQAPTSWQRALLETVVARWQWSLEQLQFLDNRSAWKAPDVIAERSLLVNELSHSYHLLMELNQRLALGVAISADELIILGRKLHAAFERKAGKIEWINPGISRDLSEAALSFVQQQTATGDTWQVLRGAQHELVSGQTDNLPMKQARSLVELLLWCYVNGMLSNSTKVDIVGKDFLLAAVQKQQLLQTLLQWLPAPMAHVEHEPFMAPAHINRMLLFFNIGVEPQYELHKKGLQMLSNQRDALGYGGFKENLVINGDVIQTNTWGELVCRHYASDALVNTLLHYLRLFPVGKNSQLPELVIRCFSSGQGNNIAHRLMELWRDIISCFYSDARPRTARYVLEMGEEYLLVQFLQQQPHIFRFKHYRQLLDKLGQAQVDFSPIIVDRYALHDKPLRVIADAIKKPNIYLFYLIEGKHADIYIADEKGSVLTVQTSFHDLHSLLRPLMIFIRSSLRRQQLQNHALALPELIIYELINQARPVNHAAPVFSASPAHGSGLAYRLETVPLNAGLLSPDNKPLHFIDIKVVVDLDEENNTRYVIYCDDHECSALVHGDNLFAQVARYIYTHRKPGSYYPCYITDLDLSRCQDALAQQTGLQLGHYLAIKVEVEQKITVALQALFPPAAPAQP